MVQLRKAEENDLTAIRNLVIELAIFEQEPDAVTASIADYQALFRSGSFACIVAEKEGVIIGIALYYDAFSTWKGKMLYLDDLIVTESYRGQGIGKLLLNAFLAKAKEKEAVLAKWQVLDWNEGAVKFYESIGATIEKDWWNVKISPL